MIRGWQNWAVSGALALHSGDPIAVALVLKVTVLVTALESERTLGRPAGVGDSPSKE